MNVDLSRRNIIHNLLALFSGTAFSQVAVALSVFLTARALGSDSFGVYAASFALTRITALIFNLGLDNWMLREGGSHPQDAGKLMGSILKIKFVGGLGWLALLAASTFFIDPSKYPLNVLMLSGLAVWVESLFATSLLGFKVLLLNQVTALLSFISGGGILLGTLALILLGTHATLPFIELRLLVAGGSLVAALFWLQRRQRLSSSFKVLQVIYSGIWPFTLSEALFLVYMYADVNIIFFMLGQSATGQYAPATSIISALYILPQAVYSVMLPILSALIAKQDSHLWKAIRGTLWGMTMMGAALWLGVGLLGPPIISLFLGPGYPLSGPVLGILSAILFLKSGSFAMVTLLTAAGWQRQRVAVQALSALVNVGLNLTFIRQYGIIGVAWIYVASEVLLLAGNLAFALHWERRTAKTVLENNPG